MKKVFISFSIVANIALASLFFLAAGKKQTKLADNENKYCDSCKNYSLYPPFNYLDVNMLHAMADKYKTTTTESIGGKTFVAKLKKNDTEDSRSIWFSLDSLKRFIWEIEMNVCKNQCDTRLNKQELGIRLYYARYPIVKKKYDLTTGSVAYFNAYRQLSGLNPNYENLHTIFMVPTYNQNGVNQDFDPRSITITNCSPKIEKGTRALIFSPLNTSTNYAAQNHGTLCPPLTNCDGSAF